MCISEVVHKMWSVLVGELKCDDINNGYKCRPQVFCKHTSFKLNQAESKVIADDDCLQGQTCVGLI